MAMFKEGVSGRKVINFKEQRSDSAFISKNSIKFLNELDYVMVSLLTSKKRVGFWGLEHGGTSEHA